MGRIVGSHHFVVGQGKRTSVPVHGAHNLKFGTMRAILRDLDIAPEEFTRRYQA